MFVIHVMFVVCAVLVLFALGFTLWYGFTSGDGR